MATSVASQLQALKSLVKVDSSDPKKRPFTRPSVLFDPKEAADIDIDTIFSIARTGLESLISKDENFKIYRDKLFSPNSKEVDRGLKVVEENKRIDNSILSYLRLLSGHLESSSAVKTLEYLIRKYKVHVYNAEELILCALPYHDTHVFVRIIQLIPSGNNKWKFLDGVRESGAPLPRQVIVQQCIRDKGVLEALCDYARPSKYNQPSRPVIGFCAAVVVDFVRSVTTVESDVITRIFLPYVDSGLRSVAKRERDQKAGVLIIISSLVERVALSPIVVNGLIRTISHVARDDAKGLADVQWVRLLIMALINLVQLQSVETFPKKAIDFLNEIRDISMVLSELSNEFNVDRFLALMLDTLIDHCHHDEKCLHMLLSILETVTVRGLVEHIVSKVLMKIPKTKKGKEDSRTGSSAKQILASLYKKYPVELRGAVHKALMDTKWHSRKQSPSYNEIVFQVLDGNSCQSHAISVTKIWFELEHPMAKVRCKTLSGLNLNEILSIKATDSQRFDTIQDAVLRRLCDDDLSVVRAVVDMKGLSEIISSTHLIDALQHVFRRCLGILMQSKPGDKSLASDVAVLCLERAISSFGCQGEYTHTLAKMVFPLILVLPKSRRLNLKTLELSKELNWPLFSNLVSLPLVNEGIVNSRDEIKSEEISEGKAALQPFAIVSKAEKKLEFERFTSLNVENVNTLTEAFLNCHEEYVPWLLECCSDLELSKTLFFLILLQSCMMPGRDAGRLSVLIVDCLPVLKNEWEKLEAEKCLPLEQSAIKQYGSCKVFLERLLDKDASLLNAEILVCLFWRLLEALVPENASMNKNGALIQILEGLFVFFSSHTEGVFKEHIHYLVACCKTIMPQCLLNLFTEEGPSVAVQVGSLSSFTYLCSESEDSMSLELLMAFPATLVPLLSDNQDLRVAAMSCIEGLHALWARIDPTRSTNENSAVQIHFLGELLDLIIQQKRIILSDRNFLPCFFTSLLSSSSNTLLVQHNMGKRFCESTKHDILVFMLGSALGLSAYAKLKLFCLLKGLGRRIINIKGVELLLNDLLEMRQNDKLSKNEVGILCALLESCCMPITLPAASIVEDSLLRALQLNGKSTEVPAVIEPCLTVLRSLSCSLYEELKIESQDLLFRALVLLFRSNKAEIQNETKDALLRINIDCSTVCRTLNFVLDPEHHLTVYQLGNKKMKTGCHQNSYQRDQNVLYFISSLLDVLLLKKGMQKRILLVESLFQLLQVTFLDGGWRVHSAATQENNSQSISIDVSYIQQGVLLLLEDIISSIIDDNSEKVNGKIDVELLISCARTASDATTRNNVLSLLSTIAKAIPDKVLGHILDILVVSGKSAVTQWDSNFQRVFEDLISAVVPCWLSNSEDISNLLQIFVDVLPQVSGCRRISIIEPLVRNLGETSCVGSLLFLLFRSLSSRESISCLGDKQPSLNSIVSIVSTEWEYALAMQLTEQYSCMIWLPSIVRQLEQTRNSVWTRELFVELVVTMRFISDKLEDPEIAFKLDSGEDSDSIQKSLGALMEQVVFYLQRVDLTKRHIDVPSRKELKEYMRTVLKTISRCMMPSSYFKVIILLLGNADISTRKAMALLCESVKDLGTNDKKHDKRGMISSLRSSWLQLDETAQESFKHLFLEILKLIDNNDSIASVKLTSVSTLEVLSNWFPLDYSLLTMCLGSIGRNICATDPSVSSCCLRATGSLINILGPRALPELPSLMKTVLQKALEMFSSVEDAPSRTINSLLMAILVTLEAVVDKLGGFLNPYLEDILGLLVLRSQYASNSDLKLKSKIDIVRKLITQKVPVRLLVPPLLRIYSNAIEFGESSLSVAFEMLGNLVVTMDRASVHAYHANIFDLCLLALDLRGQRPASVKNIDVVEKSVLNAMVALTMKLTETMFRPLFIRGIEWSASGENGVSTESKKFDRAISFYGLVNELVETHRSLFVPYFKYLLGGCVQYLNYSEDEKDDWARKKKKSKLQEASIANKGKRSTSLDSWHLKALILSSLNKCFLYDTGSLKFLDSSNFQVLLGPIVSQLVTEPPATLEQHPNIPSIREVDDVLVACVGQMAVTAGSDLLWKSLNHEVLMQTRVKKLRPRILALRIVKYLVENLKEEYLVLLAETIPFLGELLEDEEYSVKSLSQEILKDMESMSGESLRQYL